MRLPVKFLPRQSQHAGNAVGGFLIIVFSLIFMMDYLPDPGTAKGMTFGTWLTEGGVQLPFLLIIVAVMLFGLAALTVALVNLFGDSPFNHLIIDRFGIRIRSFFGEHRYSWKELGPIRPLRLSPFRAYGLDRRFWIVSDTFSGEGRNDVRRPLSTFNMKIPVAAYLGSSWLGGSVGAAMNDAAAWLESLRKLAQADALDPENAPDAPAELGAARPVTKPSDEASKPAGPAGNLEADDLPAMAERKFGRRDGPTVER
jgi:hypothetical protein